MPSRLLIRPRSVLIGSGPQSVVGARIRGAPGRVRAITSVFPDELYPNKPGGAAWTTLLTREFDALGEQGCNDFAFTPPDPDIFVDATSPGSTSNVFRAKWFEGEENLGHGANLEKSGVPAGATELYVHWYGKLSAGFALHANAQKAGPYPFRNQAAGAGPSFAFDYKLLNGTSGVRTTDPIECFIQPQVMGQPNYMSNVNTASRFFTRGQWHKHELYVRMNTPGVLDGDFLFWKDGVLTHDYTGAIGFAASADSATWASPFRMVLFAGGTADGTVPADQYHYLDHLHVVYR